MSRYNKSLWKEIERVFEGATRCLNPNCRAILKYVSRGTNRGYCCKKCEQEYPPIMVYYSRVYAMDIKPLLVMLLEKNKHKLVATAKELNVSRDTVLAWKKKFEI